jgi:hypothetical protein
LYVSKNKLIQKRISILAIPGLSIKLLFSSDRWIGHSLSVAVALPKGINSVDKVLN